MDEWNLMYIQILTRHCMGALIQKSMEKMKEDKEKPKEGSDSEEKDKADVMITEAVE